MSISNYASLNSPIHRKLWLQGFLTESERQVIIDAASGFCDPVALGMLICTLSANDIETLKVKAEAIHQAVAEMRKND